MESLFKPNTIFAALKRSDRRGFFHWMIYLCTGESSGYKYHATTDGATSEWHYECAPWQAATDSSMAVTFTKIGELPEWMDHGFLDNYLREIPMAVPKVDYQREKAFTCRVWFRAAIRQLHDSGMFVECSDVDSLESELKNRATAAEYLGNLPHVYETTLARAWRW
ncbi:hypothetical protein LshimejAT787_0704990 [Lyophyllum shimeji]|uniref:Uncharacterized protein n=1 Tax=Lyophyllum shimeji TaxID=47721 RepID=A0A9P3PR19_LYOSH|nr:hypothetical protein LshimejAT787_0704990 [Lyophyllum shimeji]